jgi:hypothetical protein
MIGADVSDDLIQGSSAVALRILDLRANLSGGPALPGHVLRREMPAGIAGHSARIEIGGLVAILTSHRSKAVAVLSTFHGWLMQLPHVALTWAIACRVAVGATGMGQHLAELAKQCSRAGLGVLDRSEALG